MTSGERGNLVYIGVVYERSSFSMWAVFRIRGLDVEMDRQADRGFAFRRESDVKIANRVFAGILMGRWEKFATITLRTGSVESER